MTIVADASVLVAALVDSGHAGKWAESAVGAGHLAGPELVLAEATHVLRRLERAGEVSGLEASASQRSLLQLDVELYPFAPFAERVWALRGNLTSYDAWYVALAESLACPLVTLDRRLSRAAGPRCTVRVPPRRNSRAES